MTYTLTGNGISATAGSPWDACLLYNKKLRLIQQAPSWMTQRMNDLLLTLDVNCTTEFLVRATGLRVADLRTTLKALKGRKLIDQFDNVWYRTELGDLLARPFDNNATASYTVDSK